METYDVIIIGGGVSGLAAAIYSARYNLKTLVIAAKPGGLIMDAHLVENYPGFTSLTGYELAQNILKHAKSYDIEIKEESAIKATKKDNLFEIKTNKTTYKAKTLILATGSKHKELNIKGEKELKNKGISYCATCDSVIFKDKTVAVIGGSDAAAKEALLLSEHAKKVYIIYRKEKIRAEPINEKKVQQNKKIEIISNTNVIEALGKEKLEKVKLDKPYKGKDTLNLDGLFIAIGFTVNSDLAKQLNCKFNEKQEIIIDNLSRTSVKGVFSAGDCTNFPWKQAITGVAQGTTAAFSAYNFIKEE